ERTPVDVGGSIEGTSRRVSVRVNGFPARVQGHDFSAQVSLPATVTKLVIEASSELDGTQAKIEQALVWTSVPLWFSNLPKDERPGLPLRPGMTPTSEERVYDWHTPAGFEIKMVYVPSGNFTMGSSWGAVPP